MRASVLDRTSIRRACAGISAAIGALILVYVLQSVASRSRVEPSVSDFRVVYCGERAVVSRADPYRVEPLRACEHRVHLESGEPSWSVTPFPLPSYTAALLAPFAFLPYRIAFVTWIALLVLCFGVAAATVARIVDVSAFAVGLVFAPTLGVLNLTYGEPVLISVAALCVAGYAVHRRRPGLAAIAAAIAMIEPHVGLPALLGTFVFVAPARRTIVIAVAILAALGFATLGFGTNLEYVAFLSAQARAEIFAQDQYSLSRLLFLGGVAPQTALALGSASYVATMLLGLSAARVFVGRGGTKALVVLVPVATAMFGGPFIHDVQVATAVPAALVLARRTWTGRVAVALLALDWTSLASEKIVSAAMAAIGTSIVALRDVTAVKRASYAVAAACAVSALAFGLHFFEPTAPGGSAEAVAAPASTATELSSIPWGWRIKFTPSWSFYSLAADVKKIPTWSGLLLVPLSAFAGRRERRERVRSQ